MSKTFRVLSLTAAAFLAAFLRPAIATSGEEPGGAPEDENLLFHVSFDHLTGDADCARGKKESSPHRNLTLGSVAGIKGMGLTTERGQAISYDAAGNIRGEQGTLAFWVKPLDWDSLDKGAFRHLCEFTAPPAIRHALVYKYQGEQNLSFYLANGSKDDGDFVGQRIVGPGNWKNGEWHHLAVTWDKSAMALFVDGVCADQKPMPGGIIRTGAVSTGGRINFLQNGKQCKTSDNTALDEIKIWAKPLNAGEILKEYMAGKYPGLTDCPPNRAVVSRATAPIKLDGRISLGEWDLAARVPVCLLPKKEFFPTACSARMAYDDQAIYFAFDSLAYDGMLKAEVTEHDGKLWTDDACELFLTPQGVSDPFQFIFNSKDVRFEWTKMNLAWNGAWESKSAVEGGRWTAEVRIPFKTLGRASAPKDGEKWELQLARDFGERNQRLLFTSWTGAGNFTGEKGGELVFGGNCAAVAIGALNGVFMGDLALSLRSFNNSSSERTVSLCAEVKSMGEGARTVWKETKVMSLAPGASESVTLSKTLEGLRRNASAFSHGRRQTAFLFCRDVAAETAV